MPHSILRQKGIEHLVAKVGSFVTNYGLKKTETSEDVLMQEFQENSGIICWSGNSFHLFRHNQPIFGLLAATIVIAKSLFYCSGGDRKGKLL